MVDEEAKGFSIGGVSSDVPSAVEIKRHPRLLFEAAVSGSSRFAILLSRTTSVLRQKGGEAHKVRNGRTYA